MVRDAWSERAALLALVVLGAVLATLVMGAGCAPKASQLRAMPMDGLHRELEACDVEASHSEKPGQAYDACLARRGL